MLERCFAKKLEDKSLLLTIVMADGFEAWLARQSATVRRWIKFHRFKVLSGNSLIYPDDRGAPKGGLVVMDSPDDLWAFGGASVSLPPGFYHLDSSVDKATALSAALGWALGSYKFACYQKNRGQDIVSPRLVIPENIDIAHLTSLVEGIYLTRDLVNTPASDMGPEELAHAAMTLFQKFSGKGKIIIGDDLLRENFPMIHAVGRASSRPPRLVNLYWEGQNEPTSSKNGQPLPLITLVGKGVCFDSGGLDIKPSQYMLLMKKDMGGAAQVLGLSAMIMAEKLPVRLRVLIPAVENSIAGNAFRPMDILSSRKGLSVEVGETDAEGRLVLADAMTLACEEKPDLLIDFATLTGAARVALGTELPALFCNDDNLAQALLKAGQTQTDPLWRLPLHEPYEAMLKSAIADVNSVSSGGYGGAITAALFLKKFISPAICWAHIDLMSWNLKTKPGRPEGGEAQGIRAIFHMLQNRYGL